MVQNWLLRDNGKHQFSEQHKQLLIEYLATALWQSGQRQWNADDLDNWLNDFLYDNPRLASIYQMKDREILKEDLRTATFIVRVDEQHFRFAHTFFILNCINTINKPIS